MVLEREHSEGAAREGRAWFEAAFEQAPGGMALVALDGGWLEANRALRELLGYPEGELRGLTVADVFHPDDLDKGLGRVLEGEVRADQVEKRLLRKDERAVWASVSVALVKDEGDEPLCFVYQAQDATKRRALEEELIYRATHDPLTGLPDRAFLLDRLEQALESAVWSGASVALLYLDLDGFKEVNDAFGHEVGDELLVAVAGRLLAGARSADTAARFGGDEFCVLLEEVEDADEAARVARRIEEGLREPFALTGAGLVSVTASVGVAVADAGETRSARQLLREADAAMYLVKDKTGGPRRPHKKEPEGRSGIGVSPESG